MTIPIVDEIFAALMLLTEKDLERSARNCKPVQSTDKTLGRLHNEMLCRLWAQGDQYRYLCRETTLRAEREADSPEESKVFLEMAARYDGLEDCCRDMFWTQAREDMGCWAAKRIGLTPQMVRYYARTGRLKSSRVGRSLLIPVAALSGFRPNPRGRPKTVA